MQLYVTGCLVSTLCLNSITLNDVFILNGLPIASVIEPCLIDSNDEKFPVFSATPTDYSSYHSLIQKNVKAISRPLQRLTS